MGSVPPIRIHDDDGAWRELEAALSVAYAALTDAQDLVDHLDIDERIGRDHGLQLGPALRVILTILDAYVDSPWRSDVRRPLGPEGDAEAES